jgi:hypothetical protein
MNRITIDTVTFEKSNYATILFLGLRLAAQAVSRKTTVTYPVKLMRARGSLKTHEQSSVN